MDQELSLWFFIYYICTFDEFLFNMKCICNSLSHFSVLYVETYLSREDSNLSGGMPIAFNSGECYCSLMLF